MKRSSLHENDFTRPGYSEGAAIVAALQAIAGAAGAALPSRAAIRCQPSWGPLYTPCQPERSGEKDAKFAQKLGQLQRFIAVFTQECMGLLASFGPTYHLSR
jgi:hypothetical protein